MAVVPEIILQRAIMSGFQAIRKDPRIINALFKNLPIHQQNAIKQYITESVIDFSINYPRADIKVPAIVLLLKNEAESQNFLWDVMGAPPNYDMPDSDLSDDILGGATAASSSSMAGLPPAVLQGLRVLEQVPVDNTLPGSPDNTYLRFVPEDQELINEVFSTRDSWPCLMLHVVSGAGIGQRRLITSITSERLDIDGQFEVNCNNTSVVDIRYAELQEGVYGEPVRTYQPKKSQLRLGANYEGQYQLEVLAGNQEEVIYLYTVLKAILFSQRSFLEAQGIMSLKLSGSDLAPRSEMLPDEIFTRSLTLMFTYPFDFLVEEDVISKLAVTISATDPNNNSIPGSTIITAEIDLEP